MRETIGGRLKHAWNAFANNKTNSGGYYSSGASSSDRQDRRRVVYNTERSVITSIYSRIAIDISRININHVRNDQNGRYFENITSYLGDCLITEANTDQTGRELLKDAVMSMFDEGVVAIVPVDTSSDPKNFGTVHIHSLRTARITEWFPKDVRINIYNDRTGMREDLIVPKNTIAIVENPLYEVMNQPNSTLKRLLRKLNLLDAADERANSGKLDIIIQLPYTVKSEMRKQQAQSRRKEIETQLTGSTYGIAYIDGSEKITQLNRSAENNLQAQIELLTSMLYSQLGLTEAVFNGTATEQEMLNYHNRTVEPILTSITEEMQRKFLTKTARTQGQSITFFKDPFKLIPVAELANIADKFTRNEILSSNEVRAIIGYKPSTDPGADVLRNKNLNIGKNPSTDDASEEEKGDSQNGK